jgi:hypothetical protein
MRHGGPRPLQNFSPHWLGTIVTLLQLTVILAVLRGVGRLARRPLLRYWLPGIGHTIPLHRDA